MDRYMVEAGIWSSEVRLACTVLVAETFFQLGPDILHATFSINWVKIVGEDMKKQFWKEL